jgi:hypothetical protein
VINFQTNRTGEKGPLSSELVNVRAFLWTAHRQAGFEDLLQAKVIRSQTDDAAKPTRLLPPLQKKTRA